MQGYCICLGFRSPKKEMQISVLRQAGYLFQNWEGSIILVLDRKMIFI